MSEDKGKQVVPPAPELVPDEDEPHRVPQPQDGEEAREMDLYYDQATDAYYDSEGVEYEIDDGFSDQDDDRASQSDQPSTSGPTPVPLTPRQLLQQSLRPGPGLPAQRLLRPPRVHPRQHPLPQLRPGLPARAGHRRPHRPRRYAAGAHRRSLGSLTVPRLIHPPTYMCHYHLGFLCRDVTAE
jgi:hypothetical protein